MKKIVSKLKHMAIAFAIIATSHNVAFSQQNVNLSGNWKLNEQKSDFQGQAANVVFNQIKINQTKDSLKISGLTVGQTDFGKSKTIAYPLNGSKITTTMSNNRTMDANLTWINNGSSLVRLSSYSLPGLPNTKDYESKETWSLITGDNELILVREFTTSDGRSTTVKALYDRQ